MSFTGSELVPAELFSLISIPRRSLSKESGTVVMYIKEVYYEYKKSDSTNA